MFFMKKTVDMPTPDTALKGRAEAIPTAELHHVNRNPLKGPYPDGIETAIFGLGCFWGAERVFWQIPGVHVTAVGYLGGYTPNPNYDEVCTGKTGHNEVVLVVFDPERVSYGELLAAFFEAHDPSQLNRQGNDVGTQYRSGIYVTSPAQRKLAEDAKAAFGKALGEAGRGAVVTEIVEAGEGTDVPFYFAEAYHQQYLSKNPMGYCGLGGTGVSCPVIAAE